MRNATKKQKAKMKQFHLAWLLVLLFCMDVRCGIFDDEATVRKARCYANCLTLVSRIPINDSSCLSSQCLECKSPCDSNFDSVANCTQNYPNSSHYFNQSCYFLGVMKDWANIYEGNKSTIGAPGQVCNITRNVNTLTLSWQPSVSTSGTVVYLLKEKMTGDKNLVTPKPLPGFVFLGPRAVLTAKDACSLAPVSHRQTRNGIDFYYTVVALTEVSVLVEGPQSSAINFKKADPVASVYGPNITYNNAPNVLGDRLEFRVSFTPLLNANDTKYVGVTKRTAGKCGTLDVQRAPRQESPNTFLTQFFEKTLECNVSFSVYRLTYCLPSEPKSVEYHYKGCNYLPSMNSSKCCLFDPVPTPDSAKAVRNLTYSLQTRSDFRFTAHITWLRPTQPCPDVIGYRLSKPHEVTFGGRTSYIIRLFARTTNTSYDLSNLEPNLVQNVTVTPTFQGDLHNLGVPKKLMITTPGFSPNETIITTMHPRILRPTSPSDRFSINISWVKPKFHYSIIDGYNVTYTVHGVVTKYNVTQQTWYVVRGLDYTQTLSYQVLPIFRHPWIETKAIQGVARLPDLNDDDLAIRAFTPISEKSFVKNSNNIYSLSVEWSRPIFQRDISYYKVSYSLTGYLNDELNCPSKPSAKRKCLTNITTSTSYVISNIRPNERIELTVTPVFENTYAFQGKAKAITARAPSGLLWSSWQIALLVLGILVFLAILVLLLILYLRWKKKEDIKNGKVDRRKGIVIDHWEVSPNNLELIEVIGEGAFGKVYKGLLQELPEQAFRTGSSSMTFGRRSIRSTRSSHPEEAPFVAVKLLHDSADDEQTREFLKEIQLMKDVGCHRNIVNMLGCGTICEPMFLIVEYLPNGDLLHYLRNRRGKATKYPESDSRGPNHSTYCQAYYNTNKPRAEATLEPVNKGFYVNTKINAGFQADKEDGGIQLVSVKTSGNEATPESKLVSPVDDEDDDETITSGDMMAFAWQVAQGMEYLSKRGYVHRDLAARNILVGNNKEAKVADFGLTRHMYENLYRAKTTRRLPLKWMSIEAIFDQTFTSQSDVWSFGILLWEIVTLGGTPYPAKTNKELLNFLKEGQRMEKPDTCDDEVYRIMLSCWKEKPDDRPTFIQIREKFEEMMTRENPYFDPSSVDESRDYYNVPSFNSIQDSDDGDDEVFNGILGFEKKNEMENQSTGEKSEKSSESEKYEVESKEKEVDIGDIESLLYRKQHHSLKLK